MINLMFFIQKHSQCLNKTAFKNKTDTLSAICLGFLLFATSFFEVLLSPSHSQKGHFCLIPHDAHV